MPTTPETGATSPTPGEEGPASGFAGRFRRLDPLVPLTGLVSLAVYLLNGFNGVLLRDIGVYAYAGQQVAEGVPPYVAILNRAGPLAHLVPGLGAWAARQVGVDDLLGMRFLFALLTAAAVSAGYVLARDVFRSRTAGLAAAATLLALRGFAFYATAGPREKTTMVLLTTLGLLALVHRRWATAGVLVALATLTWQPVLFAALPGAVAAVLLQPRGRLSGLLRFGAGGLAPLAVTVGCYALIDRLHVFWNCFVLINLRYTRQGSPLETPDRVWNRLDRAYDWSLWLLLAGLLLVVVWGLLALPAAIRRREARPAALVGIAVFTLGNLAWALKAFNGFPDAFVMFPGAAVGVAGLVPLLARRLPARVVVGVVTAGALAATALAADYSVSSRDDTLLEQRRDVDAVTAILPPHARILSVVAPEAMVLAHQRNPSRFQILSNGLRAYLDDTWPGGIAGYARWIGDRSPEVIAVGRTLDRSWLQPTLDAGYDQVGRTSPWLWYVRRDVGKDTLQRLREALATH
ncbi:hypothetical protein [Nocardioides panaciterrulae]|uniref:4-amino-4-deoxy-L-arabinose transferase-like glycosyltransferase n=1 Tax=Nocardioides panaciterrulae TaxID=661492 RepID=A0A7Y9E7Z0_9ACTN|nr:hypothetical protein [Nocardioides panaciterrulae]NYD42896.1 4-amino-4-deoxy-L-arabinose transferase-like glycosyltransferase [Nocardioides panaciterrulae]